MCSVSKTACLQTGKGEKRWRSRPRLKGGQQSCEGAGEAGCNCILPHWENRSRLGLACRCFWRFLLTFTGIRLFIPVDMNLLTLNYPYCRQNLWRDILAARRPHTKWGMLGLPLKTWKKAYTILYQLPWRCCRLLSPSSAEESNMHTALIQPDVAVSAIICVSLCICLKLTGLDNT